MKNSFTKEQIKELYQISESGMVGKVVNLACFGAGARLNIRQNRAERILPNVNSLVVLGEDGKFSPLTEQEKTDLIMKIFNDFWKRHLNFAGSYFEFIGLQDDFFTQETYFRLQDYAKIFFARRIDDEVAGRNNFKYKLDSKSEIKMLQQMRDAFNRSLYRKTKEVSKGYLRRKKETNGKESLLQELVANNLAWQDAQTAADNLAQRELVFEI